MNLIFENQLSIFEDIFYTYLTPNHCIRLYSTNKILYNIYITNNRFEEYYFIPKNKQELRNAVVEWFNNEAEAIKKYGHISNWDVIYINTINNGTYLMHTYIMRKYEQIFKDKYIWNTNTIINIISSY